MGGLSSRLHLCVGALIFLTKNFLNLGLSNGSQGIVKEIIYEDGETAPSVPKFVLVDFGDSYTGESFFPNDPSKKGWFPVYPFKNSTYSIDGTSSDGFKEHSRTQMPLKLCWAWTVHKCQGMTIKGKVVIDLGPRELWHGVSYVALSRVTKFTNIGLKKGIAMNRLCKSIKKQKKIKGRLAEEKRLNLLCEKTMINFNQ